MTWGSRFWRVLSWGASPHACQVLSPELLRGFSQGDVETSGLPPTCLSLLSAPPYLPTETPQGFWPLGPSWMEPFLAGVELIFILWEQPVVLRSASPSPVALVGFSLWRPQPSPLPRPRCWDKSQVAMPWAEKQNTTWFLRITGP